MFDRTVSDQTSELAAAHAAVTERNLLAVSATGTFGANFRRVRETLGLSHDQVAVMLGLTKEHLAEIEAGIKGKVDLDLVILMMRQLKIDYADLMVGIS